MAREWWTSDGAASESNLETAWMMSRGNREWATWLARQEWAGTAHYEAMMGDIRTRSSRLGKTQTLMDVCVCDDHPGRNGQMIR